MIWIGLKFLRFIFVDAVPSLSSSSLLSVYNLQKCTTITNRHKPHLKNKYTLRIIKIIKFELRCFHCKHPAQNELEPETAHFLGLSNSFSFSSHFPNSPNWNSLVRKVQFSYIYLRAILSCIARVKIKVPISFKNIIYIYYTNRHASKCRENSCSIHIACRQQNKKYCNAIMILQLLIFARLLFSLATIRDPLASHEM